MDADRKRVLIGVLLTLLSLRFVVLPWLEMQADARERLEVLTNRLDRSAGVVMNRNDITQSAMRLEQANLTVRASFPSADGPESSRLASQQRVTEIAATQSLTIEGFEWIFDSPAETEGIPFVRGRIYFKGDMRRMAFLLGTLETQLPNMTVREAVHTFENPVYGSDEYRTSLMLIADFYFRPKAAQ